MKKSIVILVVFCCIGVGGCARTISVEELQGVLVEREFSPIDFWWYVGSDEDYHYLKNHLLIGSKSYRISRDELVIANTFERSSDKSDWVVFHDLGRLREGRIQQTDSD